MVVGGDAEGGGAHLEGVTGNPDDALDEDILCEEPAALLVALDGRRLEDDHVTSPRAALPEGQLLRNEAVADVIGRKH